MDDPCAKPSSARAQSPRLASSFYGNVDRADDLVQETLLRALANIDSFQPGTNMSAWLFTICATISAPNTASGGARWRMAKAIRRYAENPARPDRPGRVRRTPRGAGAIAADQREALVLVGASASPTRKPPTSANVRSDHQVAVNRARARSAELIGIDSADQFGPDQQTRAVLASGE